MNKKIFNIALVVSIISLFAVYSSISDAGLFSKSEKKVNYPFPTDEESFAAKAKVIEESPQGNPIFEFSITLPNDWVKNEYLNTDNSYFSQNDEFGALQKDLPNDLASYQSPFMGSDKATVSVQTLQLFHEISAKYWLERYLNTQNYLPLEEIKEISTKEAVVSYAYMDNAISRNTRIRAIINGNNVFIVKFETPSNYEKPLAFLQSKVLDSFKIKNISEDSIEVKKTAEMGDDITVSYPTSWTMYKLDTEDARSMVLQIHNIETIKDDYTKKETKKINGLIEVSVIKRRDGTNLMVEAQKLKERLESSMDVKFDEVIESKKADANEKFIFNRYESYIAKSNDPSKQDKEIHLAVLGDEKWYVIAFLYTPAKELDSYNWARNMQSFSSIIKDIR